MATTTQLLRHINARRVLRLLKQGMALSRAEIARELGLNKATVGNAINYLLSESLVIETESQQPQTRVGRPGVSVVLNTRARYALGLEIGMRGITGFVVDLMLNRVARQYLPTGDDYHSPERMCRHLVDLTEQLVKSTGISRKKIVGIGVAVPGLVNNDGIVINAPLLGWRNFHMREFLLNSGFAKHWIVDVQNDAASFARAEYALSEHRGVESLLFVLLTEGIGGALVYRGRALNGARGYAGEIGHMILTANGKTGMFELLAGASFFESVFPAGLSLVDAVRETAANASHGVVADMLDDWSRILTVGLANAVHMFDPHKVVIGGPLSLLYPVVADRVFHGLAESLVYGVAPPEISIAGFGAEGGAIGAAAGVLESVFEMPETEKKTLFGF